MKLFQEISDAFEKATIAFVLVGGHAVNHYGVTRHTADVDLMILSSAKDGAVGVLATLGYREDHSSELFVRCIRADAATMDVDLLLVAEDTLAKIRASAVPVAIEEREVLVPSLDHLLAMKLHSLRYTPARMLKDGGDIVALLLEHHRNPDDIQDICDRFGSDAVMKKIRFLYECEQSA
jgi:hypothetical protein